MFLGDALLQPGVALTELQVAFFGGFVQLRGDAPLEKFEAILGKDTEKALKLRDGSEQFFQTRERDVIHLTVFQRLNGICRRFCFKKAHNIADPPIFGVKTDDVVLAALIGIKHAQAAALYEINVAFGFSRVQQPGALLHFLKLEEGKRLLLFGRGKRYMQGKIVQDQLVHALRYVLQRNTARHVQFQVGERGQAQRFSYFVINLALRHGQKCFGAGILYDGNGVPVLAFLSYYTG
jgi:hypothetical protein